MCLHTAQIAFRQANSFGLYSAAFSALTTKQYKTCNAFGLCDNFQSLPMESNQVSLFRQVSLFGEINRNLKIRKDVVFMLR